MVFRIQVFLSNISSVAMKPWVFWFFQMTSQQIEKKVNIWNREITDYEYISDRLLRFIKESGVTRATYYYDALGRRTKIVEGNISTFTLYSGNDIVYEAKKEDTVETKTRYLVLNGKYIAKMVGINLTLGPITITPTT